MAQREETSTYWYSHVDEGEEPTLVTDPVQIQAALQEHWAPIYAIMAIDVDAAAKLLMVYRGRNLDKFNFTNLSLPDREDFLIAIRKAKHSAPGRDGFPYQA